MSKLGERDLISPMYWRDFKLYAQIKLKLSDKHFRTNNAITVLENIACIVDDKQPEAQHKEKIERKLRS